MASVTIMASVTYGKCYLWQKYYVKCNYGKNIMANETEPYSHWAWYLGIARSLASGGKAFASQMLCPFLEFISTAYFLVLGNLDSLPGTRGRKGWDYTMSLMDSNDDVEWIQCLQCLISILSTASWH